MPRSRSRRSSDCAGVPRRNAARAAHRGCRRRRPRRRDPHRRHVRGGAARAGVSAAQLRRRLADTGVRVHADRPAASACPGTPKPAEVPAENRSYFEFTEERCYQAAEALEAETINLAHFGGGAVAEQAFIDCLGPRRARPPPRGAPDPRVPARERDSGSGGTAQRIVSGVGSRTSTLLLDTWHFARSGGTLGSCGTCRRA